MNAVLKRIVFILVFLRPVGGFIKQHMNGTIEKCSLTQLHTENGDVRKIAVSLPLKQICIELNGKVQK